MQTAHSDLSPSVRARRLGRPLLTCAAAMAMAFTVMPTGAVAADAPINDRRPVEASDRIEALEIGCTGGQRDGVAAIRCRWTVPTHPDAVRVTLIRLAVGTDTGRTAVFRTGDLSENTFVDRPVRVGVRYLYAVRSIDADGNVVGASRPVSVGVRPERPDVDALRLECRQISDIRVACEWSDPSVDGRVMTLWRSVDGAARERVTSFSNPFPTTYVDGVPTGTSAVAYAVIVTDGDGEIVARSRADFVRLRNVDEPPLTVPADSVPPVRVVPQPTVTRPTTTPPADTRPVETRPAEPAPVETRPADPAPVETRPAGTRPAETRPSTTVPAEPTPVETQPVDPLPVDTRPAETRPERPASEAGDERHPDRTDPERTERTRD